VVLTLRSRRVVFPDGVRPASIEIQDGRIASIDAYEDDNKDGEPDPLG